MNAGSFSATVSLVHSLADVEESQSSLVHWQTETGTDSQTRRRHGD